LPIVWKMGQKLLRALPFIAIYNTDV